MEFVPAIRKCLRDWITFSGRAPRSEYWWFALFLLIIYFVIVLIFGGFLLGGLFLIGDGGNFVIPGIVVGVIAGLILLYLYMASISAGVRRLHDRNMSGWWMGGAVILSFVQIGFETAGMMTISLVLSITSIILGLFLLVVMILRGTDGPNRFGEDPLTEVSAEVFE